MNNTFKTAFTLVELLVVIAIVGILSGLIIVGMSSSVYNANIAKAQVFSTSLRDSLMMNLLLEWKLDETSGTTATNTWSAGNNGTLTSFNFDTTDGWRSGSQCISNGCLLFDGTDDFVTSTVSQLTTYTQPITIEAWINIPSSYTWANGTIASIPATNYGIGIFRYSTNNTITFAARIGGSATYGNSSYIINRDKWYSLVFSGNGSTFDAYVNGNKITTGGPQAYGITAGSDITNVFRLASNLIFGGNGGDYIDGYIDNVRLYNAAVPAFQIKENYYSGINRLLAKKGISLDEYNKRINNL